MTIKEACDSALRAELQRVRGREERLAYAESLERDADKLEAAARDGSEEWAAAYREMAAQVRAAAEGATRSSASECVSAR